MYELLNKVIENKENVDIDPIDDQESQFFSVDDFIDDYEDEDEEEEIYYYVRIVYKDEDYTSSYSYPQSEIHDYTISDVFYDQMNELPDAITHFEDDIIGDFSYSIDGTDIVIYI